MNFVLQKLAALYRLQNVPGPPGWYFYQVHTQAWDYSYFAKVRAVGDISGPEVKVQDMLVHFIIRGELSMLAAVRFCHVVDDIPDGFLNTGLSAETESAGEVHEV